MAPSVGYCSGLLHPRGHLPLLLLSPLLFLPGKCYSKLPALFTVTTNPPFCTRKFLLCPLGSNHKGKGHLSSVTWSTFVSDRCPIPLGMPWIDVLLTKHLTYVSYWHSGLWPATPTWVSLLLVPFPLSPPPSPLPTCHSSVWIHTLNSSRCPCLWICFPPYLL